MKRNREQNKVRVGVVQLAPVLMDAEACLKKALFYIDEAASKGCELVMFPEAYIPCYPKAITFGSVIGWGPRLAAVLRQFGRGRRPYFQRPCGGGREI